MQELDFSEHQNGVRTAFFPALKNKGLLHGISTRQGGVSENELASLNLGAKVGDSEKNLLINRRLFCEAIGVDPSRVVASGQIHGDRVVVVDESQAWQRIADSDGLITATPGLPLLLFFADCVPLLIYDPIRQVIGLSHAGWKGSLLGIGPKTIALMKKEFGSRPADCIVGIGPSIGPEDYEVDSPVVAQISRSWPNNSSFLNPGRENHWMLDLWKWNKLQMQDFGVLERNIFISGYSTARYPETFFSHRASKGQAGRLGVLMML